MRPPRDAWIEMIIASAVPTNFTMRPPRDAWIEIINDDIAMCISLDASPAGRMD